MNGKRTTGTKTSQPLPLELRWDSTTRPVPVRCVRPPRRGRRRAAGSSAPWWVVSGSCSQAFDFSWHMKRLCEDIVQRCPELAHIDPVRILIGLTQARTGRRWGLQARVTPLRFRDGQLTCSFRGTMFHVQRYFVDGCEMLYLMTFCLPRFLEQTFDEKLVTLFHELYHIGPEFNGDIRRHPGRYGIHSHSKCQYDRLMTELVGRYLGMDPNPDLFDFLRLDFAQLLDRHDGVIGMVVPRPRLVPLAVQARLVS